MKKLSLIAAAIALASSSAFAATTTDSFDVTVSFTGACTVKAAPTDISFTYAAFGDAQSASRSTVFACSRGLTPTFKFDDTSTSQTGSAAAALGTDITAEGVISGVRYTLSGSTAKTTTGSAASAGTGGTGGNLPVNQACNGATGTGTHTRTLTITY